MDKLFIIFLIWNILVLLLYAIDKICAKTGRRRIRESTLITTAFLFGGIGAMFGMVLFNHKTSKLKFRIPVPLAVILNAALVSVFVYLVNTY